MKSDKPGCLLLAMLSLLFSLEGWAAKDGPLRPNIVMILADDLGFSDLGCYGGEIATPNLDKLAKGGMRFSQFYTTPRCCPTRAALLTGLYPHQAGIGAMMENREAEGYRGELTQRNPTIAEELRPAGYHPLMVGKWHVNHIFFDGKRQLDGESSVPFWDHKNGWPLQRGFEEYYGTIHGVCSFYDPFSLVDGNTPVRAGRNYFYTDAISDKAVDYINRYANRAEPFFLYTAYTAPHWPLHAPEADIAKYRPIYAQGWDAIREQRYRRQIKMGLVSKNEPLSPRDPPVIPWGQCTNQAWEANRMAAYAAMVERMDKGIGRILAELKNKGIEQNTLVIFMTDNGACAEVIQPEWYDVPSKTRDGRKIHVGNDHSAFAGPEDVWQSYGLPWANVSNTPWRLYKHFAHEGGISTPFIARWPAVIKSRGKLTPQLAHVTDLMATFADVAGAQHPATRQGQATIPLEGRSLLPIFQGRTRTNAVPIFWEHEGNRAVRSGPWKLVSQHPNAWELYNVEKDRVERNNVAAQYPEIVKEMAALYDQWAARCQVLPWEKLPPPRKIEPAKVTDAP